MRYNRAKRQGQTNEQAHKYALQVPDATNAAKAVPADAINAAATLTRRAAAKREQELANASM